MDRESIVLESLKIQWDDFKHTRNQSWSILNYALVFVAAIFAADIKGVAIQYRITLWAGATALTSIGYLIAHQHVKCQDRKLAAISNHEEALALVKILAPVRGEDKSSVGKAARKNEPHGKAQPSEERKPKGTVARYIAALHMALCCLCLVMLLVTTLAHKVIR